MTTSPGTMARQGSCIMAVTLLLLSAIARVRGPLSPVPAGAVQIEPDVGVFPGTAEVAKAFEYRRESTLAGLTGWKRTAGSPGLQRHRRDPMALRRHQDRGPAEEPP